mmetsp:Transcript_9402/g.17389  ORF Transcript_9402/g.17389 Transcript_9402/m.17389 type:complete len:200 (-) Transcript_9402:173-772(-)
MCPFIGEITKPGVLLYHVLLLQVRHDIFHEVYLALHGHVHSRSCARELREPDFLAEALVLFDEVPHAVKAAPIAMDGNGINSAVITGIEKLLHPRGALANVTTHGWAHQLLNPVVSSHLLYFTPHGSSVPRIQVRLGVDVGLVEAKQGPKLTSTCTAIEASVVHHGEEINTCAAPVKMRIQLPVVTPRHSLLECMKLMV